METILNYTKEEIEEILDKNNFEKYRASQIFSNLKIGKKFNEMNLPIELKNFLSNNYIDLGVSIFDIYESKIDETKKFLLKLEDNNIIEAVLMKYDYGYTICISTQVGCRMGCAFCISGKDGLIRNLSSGEIISEVIVVNQYLYNSKKKYITNIVLMGSGEPFDNYDNVLKFLKQINSKNLLNISRRNISLSTCGLVDKINKFIDDGFYLTLTISLHASNDDIRKKIMPIANKYSIKEIFESAKNYYKKTGRRVIFEYTIIYNFNDFVEHALELSNLLKGFPTHLNIINLNEGRNNMLKKTTNKRLNKFINELKKNNISFTLRRSLGSDIEGACGQLRQHILSNERSDI